MHEEAQVQTQPTQVVFGDPETNPAAFLELARQQASQAAARKRQARLQAVAERAADAARAAVLHGGSPEDVCDAVRSAFHEPVVFAAGAVRG